MSTPFSFDWYTFAVCYAVLGTQIMGLALNNNSFERGGNPAEFCFSIIYQDTPRNIFFWSPCPGQDVSRCSVLHADTLRSVVGATGSPRAPHGEGWASPANPVKGIDTETRGGEKKCTTIS